MRLWSIHPKYLDRVGLVAAWREALLAQAVLVGRTRGYRHHPQLERFRTQTSPRRAIAGYLEGLRVEATVRGYRFDRRKVRRPATLTAIPVTRGQLAFELDHLRVKLAGRNRPWLASIAGVRRPAPHPLFIAVPGRVASWERGGVG